MNPVGAFIGDSDVQNFTSGRKTFFNQTFGLRNPSNTGTLTFTTPEFTGDKEHRLNQPYSYMIWHDGTTVFAMNGATGAIEITGTGSGASTTVIQYVLTALATLGGLIHFAAGIYNVNTQLTIPQHGGVSITIEGEGWRNTLIKWTGSASATDYLLESYSTDAAGRQTVTIKDIQFWGGSATNNRLVKVLHLGRTDPGANALYDLYNVRVANGISPQIVCNYIQDSHWYNVYAESLGSTPSGIIDLEISSGAHVNLQGCNIGAVTVNASRLQCFGGTMQYLDIQGNVNYTTKVDGTFFDPVPVSLTHQIQVGSASSTLNTMLDNITFSSDTNTPASHRYIKVDNSTNCTIRNPKFPSGNTVNPYIEVTSNATGTVIDYPTQEAVSKITDAGTNTVIRSPYINNILYINNPSGTLGASIIDSFTSNRLQLANSAAHLDASVFKNSATSRVRLTSRNAANSASVVRFQTGANLQNQGLSPNESLENLIFSGGVSIIPFQKAGAPVDGDFLNPTNGLLVQDITNAKLYVRQAGAWVEQAYSASRLTGTLGVASGGTGAATLTGILKGNGTSAITAAAQLAIADGGTGQATATAAFDALSPLTTLGDLVYNNGTNDVRLAGNTTTVKQYLTQTGNGSVSAAPAWATPKSIGQFDFFNATVATFTSLFYNMNLQISNATETVVDNIWDYTVTVKRFRLVVHSNTKNGNTVVSLRDDAADVTGTALTIGAGVTGEQDSGVLSVDIAAGSKINWKIDCTASSSGSITMWGWVVWEATLQ